ncbi:MAG: DUF2141 domain-containing protein [Parvularculaceae bacterium]
MVRAAVPLSKGNPNVRIWAALALLMIGAGAARADSASLPDPLSRYADPESVVLAVQSAFKAPGGLVRLIVYDREDGFLERAAARYWAELDERGLAVLPLRALEPGAYAFVVYFDENRDGRLNRGALGRPKEPVAFSNGVKPKLRRPKFDEVKVAVERGSVVMVTLD